MKNKFSLGFFALLISFPVFSAQLVCSGTVEVIAYHANNRLMIQLSSMNVPVFFCNPDAEWVVAGTSYTTGPDTCKTLYSAFLTTKTTKATISSMYFDGDQVPASCNTWATWQNANIRFFSF